MRIFKGSRVLWYECIGFGMVVVFSWMDEANGVSQALFGGRPHVRDWRDSALQTLVVIYVWAIVFGLTKRLVDRLRYLEGLLRICAWCRKVGHRGRWVRLEDYFAEGFHVQTTHGMCPDCFKKMEEDTAEFRRKEIEEKSAPAAAEEAAQAHVE